MFWQDVSVQNVSLVLYWCHWEAQLVCQRCRAAIEALPRYKIINARVSTFVESGDGGGLGLEMN